MNLVSTSSPHGVRSQSHELIVEILEGGDDLALLLDVFVFEAETATQQPPDAVEGTLEGPGRQALMAGLGAVRALHQG